MKFLLTKLHVTQADCSNCVLAKNGALTYLAQLHMKPLFSANLHSAIYFVDSFCL